MALTTHDIEPQHFSAADATLQALEQDIARFGNSRAAHLFVLITEAPVDFGLCTGSLAAQRAEQVQFARRRARNVDDFWRSHRERLSEQLDVPDAAMDEFESTVRAMSDHVLTTRSTAELRIPLAACYATGAFNVEPFWIGSRICILEALTR